MQVENTPEPKSILFRVIRMTLVFLVCGLIILWAGTKYLTLLNSPPENFPVDIDIVLETGLTIREIASDLHVRNVIRSPHYFYLLFRTDYKNLFPQAGTYRFTKSLTSHEIIDILVTGANQSPAIKLTFPEGFRTKDIRTYLKDQFPHITIQDFEQYEGYLFPDTYFLTSDMSGDDLIMLMRDTFTKKLEPLQEQIQQTRFTEKDVVILASIIEREASDTESKKIVSGILQNRLEIGMPLQVDASFDYLFGKESHEVTSDDLEHNSPYNSYEYTGLPPTPISNPGLESIMAVLEPTQSEYLYYLTGDDGKFYYAKTFEQHKVNKSRYLR